jgi:hypothetical protein
MTSCSSWLPGRMMISTSASAATLRRKNRLVPKVRAGLGRKQLQELGTKLERARKKALRSPAQPGALKKTVDAIIP